MLHGKCTINIRFGCNQLAEAQLSFVEYINSPKFKLLAASIIPILVLSVVTIVNTTPIQYIPSALWLAEVVG